MPSHGHRSPASRIRSLAAAIEANAGRVAVLGCWPDEAAMAALVSRLPTVGADGQQTAPGLGGFDAGIACALDLIPRKRQGLAARLHAAYTPTAVDQARSEIAAGLDPDSETAWWLAACSCCEEGPSEVAAFLDQVDRFIELVADRDARHDAASATLASMRTSFEIRDGVAWALRDGGMQGAYLAGNELAVMRADAYDLWFVGTFHRSLGLEDFRWEEPGQPDATDRSARTGRSGPVGGSPQFVRCASERELTAVLDAIRLADGKASVDPQPDVEILSTSEYPAGALSNFSPHAFVFDGEPCASMEGLLQSLKFEDVRAAEVVRSLTGFRAKRAGFDRNETWKAAGRVWWKGRPIDRLGDEYQRLLDDAYRALYTQNAEARAALLATGDAALLHPKGDDDPHKTVLTEDEFCRRLEAIRAELS